VKTNACRALSILCALFLCNVAQAAVVVPIEGPAKALLASKDPTLTMLFPAEKPATATILLIPGGDGYLPMRLEATETKNPWFLGIFGPLFKEGFNVVVVSNPYRMDYQSGIPGADRLDRIESVVRYYRERLKVPMFLFGHSNGAAAAIEFANRSAENRQLVDGVVLSSARAEFSLSPEVKLPVLILHHKADSCPRTPYRSAVTRFERLKAMNADRVRLVTIEGGKNSPDACNAGHHMYFNVYQEVAAAIENNLAR
jgi:alpha/beta superfamily hydrolase